MRTWTIALCFQFHFSGFDRVVHAPQKFEIGYLFNLSEPINPVYLETNLLKLWTQIQPKWFGILAKAPTIQSIISLFSSTTMKPVSQTPVILYDDGIQTDRCDVTCRSGGNLTRNCGIPGQTLSFSCIKLDTSIRNEADLVHVQLVLKDLWSNNETNKASKVKFI